MNTQIREPSQDEIDADLERRIENARIAMTNAQTLEARREWHEEFRWLIEQRSDAQKERMAARLPGPWRS